jgi:hypothetical protein
MKYLLNQRGYALLIVMLTIIIFLSLSAVFINASINHVTQERTVDTNNQAVNAAEMGLKKISKDIENELLVFLPELEKDYIKQVGIINTNYLNEKENLSVSKTLLLALNNQYYINVMSLINMLDVSDYSKPLNSDDLTLKQTIDSNKNTYFYLNSLQKNIDNDNNLFKITVDVNGVNVNEKNIVADINLNIPRAYFNKDNRLRYIEESVAFNVSEFFETPDRSCLDLIQMNIEDINKLLKPIECILEDTVTFDETQEFIDLMVVKGLTEKDFHFYIESFQKTLCNSSMCSSNPFNKMEDTTLFILGDAPAKNVNNSGGFQLYVNGIIYLKNAKNFGESDTHTVMLGKSLEIKALEAVNSTFVLIGVDPNQGFFKGDNQDPKLELSANSKVCVNLDGFHSAYIKNFKDITGGKVYYFTSSSTTLGSNSIKVSSLNELYETCNLTKFYSADELGSLQFSEVKY